MKRTLFIIALVILTNLATYKVCVGIYEKGYRELESKNDIAMKVIVAYEKRFDLTKRLTDLVVAQYQATNENDFVKASEYNKQIDNLSGEFQDSNKELEQLKNATSTNN